MPAIVEGSSARRSRREAATRWRGRIDVVGAGGPGPATLAASLATGASPREAMEWALAAASVVVHQLGTTGTASVAAIAHRLGLDG